MNQTIALSSDQPYYDLGKYHRAVKTANTEAQIWFDRGLIWSYGFNHQASAECFEQAILHDPKCCMAYWGLAYALGPNYNKPWDIFDEQDREKTIERTHNAARKARETASNEIPLEQALAEAVQSRYPRDHDTKDWSIWNQGYAKAMETVYQKFPNDLDVAALYADALMNLTPWALWDLSSGEPAPNARTLEAKSVLDQALSQPGGLQHPGLLHLYIHLMEMSGTPEIAMPIADHLRGLVPDAGHLDHMPTHLDILCGDYRRAIASNSDAIKADEKFLAREGALNFYTLYRCHDYHFRIYAGLFAGQFKVALETVRQLESTIPPELLRVESPPMADWLEGFIAMRVHVLIRFGKWQEIIDLEFDQDRDLYCTTTAMKYYAKGVALAATGKITDAANMQVQFRAALLKVKPSRTLFNNTCLDILAVASEMLEGELEYRRGNFDQAFEHLRKAISLDDNLPYDEPWGWMQPTRHAYGALLLEQGRTEEAAELYAADLGFNDSLPRSHRHPNNVWALHGYYECLTKLGRTAEARIIEPQLKMAIAMADVPITSSCFCRRG